MESHSSERMFRHPVASILNSPVLVTTLVSFLIFVASYKLYTFLHSPETRLNVPILGKATDNDFRKALVEGWAKYRESIFKVPFHHHTTIILPRRFISEIKNLPENKISFQEEINVRHQGKYTLFRLEDTTLIDNVKNELTRSLVAILDALQDEAHFIANQEIGAGDEWKSLPMYPTMLRMISLLSGRIFVGLPLSRSEEWMKTSINFTTDTVIGSANLVKHSPWLRPLMARINPTMRRCRAHGPTALRLLGPIIKSRISSTISKPDAPKPSDFIQWHLDRSPKDKKFNLNYQCMGQLKMSFAAIHTTSQNLTHVFFDLASHPEYITPLREELEGVLAGCDGVLTKQSITKLRKLDSFMKESQRVNPPSLLGLQRKIMSDIELSDGTILPAGSFTATNLWSTNFDTEIWGENAKEFDGWRFEKLRNLPGNDHKYQLVTSDLDTQVFGLGTHACPGRFFASNEMKVLLCRIILEYDMKLPDGTTRPVNHFVNFANLPPRTAPILFRKRRY